MREGRRAFLGRLVATAAITSFASCVSLAPARRVPRLGYIGGLPEGATRLLRDGFRDGLRDYGYVEDETLQIAWRYSDEPDPYEEFIAEFVRMPVDVIVTGVTTAQHAARRATTTIPIVMTQSRDPVAAGFVDSLARPGGNFTGMATNVGAVSSKRLELLRELAPAVVRVGAISQGAIAAEELRSVQEAAGGLTIEIVDLVVGSDPELIGALDLATKRRVEALLVMSVPNYIISRAHEIAGYALARRIPVAYPVERFVEAGGLISFGVSLVGSFRRAAYFVDRILKGTKPADLPIEQPTTFETVVNLTAAREIGLTIPPSVMSRATRVIQ